MTVTDGLQLGVQALLRDFRPIDLQGLEARAALMDREDRKYVVPLPALADLLSTLRDRMEVLEVGGRRSSRYDSTYFDTVDAQLFRAHAQGRRLRYKVRTREYSDLGTRYVEVKLKGPRGRTVKVRQRCTEHEHRHGGAEVLAFTAHAVGAQYGQPPTDHLVPTLTVRYDRSTLVASTDELRVTIDSRLVFLAPDGSPVARLKDGLVLLEVKSPSGRSDVDTLLLRQGLRPQSFSKYSLGLISARDDVPAADLRWAARRYLDLAGSSHQVHPRQPVLSAPPLLVEASVPTPPPLPPSVPSTPPPREPHQRERLGAAVTRVLALAEREAARIVAEAEQRAAALTGAGQQAATPGPVHGQSGDAALQARAARLRQTVDELAAQADTAEADLQRLRVERDEVRRQVEQATAQARLLAQALQAATGCAPGTAPAGSAPALP